MFRLGMSGEMLWIEGGRTLFLSYTIKCEAESDFITRYAAG